ncbi:hypothetical protein J2W49_001657 [Hydrogenophaga palleronii]|uniref:Uncharacterized protein n=1 Tax=Hydrogenophaga palleronii TaxID=65655 RepID=A0ABU1WLA3_9BURK|nr:hypothetical protein [Hydrogenophaga palleronii]
MVSLILVAPHMIASNPLPIKKSQIHRFYRHKSNCKFGIQYMHEPTPRCLV